MAWQRPILAALAVIVVAGVSFQPSPAHSQQLIQPHWFLEGDQRYGLFGTDVDGAGDVNGDGYADIIVGWRDYSGKLRYQGVVFVYHGGPSGPAAAPDWQFEGEREYNVGDRVAGAGDVNKDGYDDVLVTVLYYSGTYWSAVFLFLGGPGGLSSTPDWIGTPLPEYQGYYGGSIAGGGDVNGDGYADILIGDPLYDDESMLGAEGRVYIYLGGERGIHDGRPFIFDGSGQLGTGLAFAGDVNGDGYDDVVMGEPHYNYINNGSGRALVHYGFSGGVQSQPAWTFTLDGHRWSDLGYEVSGAGDVNHDGFDDILVGQPYFFGGGILCLNLYAGRANVFYGGPNGLANEPDLIIEQPHSGCDNTGFGQSLDAAGDVNGDGVDDVLIGWWAGFHDGYRRGDGFVHFGADGGLAVTPDWYFKNEGAGSLAGAGDVNGDGFDDVLASFPEHNNAFAPGVGSVSLYFGGPTNPTGADSPSAPATAVLHQNQPNPFNPTTTIRYDVPAPGAHVELAVYDVAGRLVRALISRQESSGQKTVQWDGRRDDGAPAASGVYLYRITIGDFAETRKMVLLK